MTKNVYETEVRVKNKFVSCREHQKSGRSLFKVNVMNLKKMSALFQRHENAELQK